METDLLFAFISTTEHRITPAVWNVITLELRTSLLDWRLSFRFCFSFCLLMFVYQAKIIQYCFYHKPPKNSTVLHSPLPRQISTVYAQNRPQVETVSHCTYPSRVKTLQYIRRPPSYKPHQPLSSFPACLAKHPFHFLPEIRSLRQVANELYGHINSALAIYIFLCGHISTL